jgi:hypothetical protein
MMDTWNDYGVQGADHVAFRQVAAGAPKRKRQRFQVCAEVDLWYKQRIGFLSHSRIDEAVLVDSPEGHG